MTKSDTAFLACRILALWVFAQAITHLAALPSAFGVLAAPESKNAALFALSYSVLPFVLLLALSIGLWAGAGRLSARMAQTSSADTVPLTRNIAEQVAFTIIGVFLIAQDIPLAAQHLFSHLLMTPDMQRGTYAAFVGKNWELVARFIVGLWLITGAPSLSRWLAGIRQPAPQPF